MPPMRAESRVATEQLDELAHQLGPPLQHLADRMKQFGQALTQFSLALEEHVAPAIVHAMKDLEKPYRPTLWERLASDESA